MDDERGTDVNLEERVNTLEVTTALLSKSVDSIDGTLKEISGMLNSMRAIEERQTNQNNAMSRAFTEIKEVRLDLREGFAEARTIHERFAGKIQDNRDSINKWVNRGFGVQVAVGVIWAVATVSLALYLRH
jgi:uncharacterized coiled-coil protein SlyX